MTRPCSAGRSRNSQSISANRQPMLPAKKCDLGFTSDQVEQICAERLSDFQEWHFGQTFAICPDHGPVVYGVDLAQWMNRGQS